MMEGAPTSLEELDGLSVASPQWAKTTACTRRTDWRTAANTARKKGINIQQEFTRLLPINMKLQGAEAVHGSFLAHDAWKAVLGSTQQPAPGNLA